MMSLRTRATSLTSLIVSFTLLLTLGAPMVGRPTGARAARASHRTTATQRPTLTVTGPSAPSVTAAAAPTATLNVTPTVTNANGVVVVSGTNFGPSELDFGRFR